MSIDENTMKIVNACKQVIRSFDDNVSDTMTTPLTLVHACEQLNCVITKIKEDNLIKKNKTVC